MKSAIGPSPLIVLSLVLVSGLAVLMGAPTWLLIFVASLSWVWVLGVRYGFVLAFAGAVLGVFWLMLTPLVILAPFGLPVIAVTIVMWMLVGFAAGIVMLRRSGPSVVNVHPLRSIALPSSLGGLVWLGSMAVAAIIPSGARLAWVMLGDSANNLTVARSTLMAGGIAIAGGDNPVPLPSAVLATLMSSGRSSLEGTEILRHDLGAFAQTWGILIALTCLMSGLVVGYLARAGGARPSVVRVAAAAGSLLPLSWLFTGYPIEYGFLNTHFAVPILLASVLVFLHSDRYPAASFSLLAIASTLLLATWSPLVPLTGILAVIVVLRNFRVLVASRGRSLGLIVFGLVQLVLYGLTLALPALLKQGSVLANGGGVYPFPRPAIVVIAVIVLGLAFIAFRTIRNLIVAGAIGLVGAGAISIALLLFISRNQPSPWTYYPLKLFWLVMLLLIVLALGLAIAAVGRVLRGRLAQLVATGVILAGLVGGLSYLTSTVPGYRWMNPVQRLISGQVLGEGDRVANDIIELSSPAESHILWQSGDPEESTINFWSLHIRSGPLRANDLLFAAYGLYDKDDINELCRIVGLLGGGTIVHTSNIGLKAELDKACPSEPLTVVPWVPSSP